MMIISTKIDRSKLAESWVIVIDGGTIVSAMFTVPEPGEHEVICTVAGHNLSIKGEMVVD